MPPSDGQWRGSWIKIARSLLEPKIFHDFAFLETVIGNYYFTGHGILSRLHKQTARDASTGRGCWSLTVFQGKCPSLAEWEKGKPWARSSWPGLCLISINSELIEKIPGHSLIYIRSTDSLCASSPSPLRPGPGLWRPARASPG